MFKALLFVLAACVLLLAFGGIPKAAAALSPTPEKRDAVTAIGAIRWDAWYAEPRGEESVIAQVERSLSPAEFHFRAPFFARVTDEGGIIIDAYTQEIFDREMQYAMQAGLDYFAYVWYAAPMNKARLFHQASRYKNDIKLCSIFEERALGDETVRAEVRSLIADGLWQTVQGGRPLMYYFVQTPAVPEEIAYYRQMCAEIGVPEPFAVVMPGMTKDAKAMDAEAISDYAMFGTNGAPFSKLVSSAEMMWKRTTRDGGQIVPLVTTGWHNGPRIQNPVSWTKPGAESWVQYPQPGEIGEHLSRALAWVNDDEAGIPVTLANTLLIYAWNEHDEGGWLCPTIAVDEHGNQLYEADGTPKLDTQRIAEVGAVLKAYKASAMPAEGLTTPAIAAIGAGGLLLAALALAISAKRRAAAAVRHAG